MYESLKKPTTPEKAVAPMDKSGYFTFGAANDFTSTAARFAKHLMVKGTQC